MTQSYDQHSQLNVKYMITSINQEASGGRQVKVEWFWLPVCKTHDLELQIKGTLVEIASIKRSSNACSGGGDSKCSRS